MAIYKRNIVDINLDKGIICRDFVNYSIGSGDQNANLFGIRVYRGKEPEDLTGVLCQGVFRDPMGNNIALTSHGTVRGNVAYLTLPQACYNYEGNFCLAIKLIGGGVTGTMRIVDGVVDNTHTGNTVAPTGAVPTYQEIIAQYDAMVEATEEAIEATVARTNQLLNYEDCTQFNATLTSVHGMTTSSHAKVALVPVSVEEATVITVHRGIVGKRFSIGLSTDASPEIGDEIRTYVEGNDNAELSLDITTADKSLLIYYYLDTQDTDYSAEEMLASIMVNYGPYTEYEPYYVPIKDITTQMLADITKLQSDVDDIEEDAQTRVERCTQLLDYKNALQIPGTMYNRTNGVQQNTYGKVAVVPISPTEDDKKITVHRDIIGSRFSIGLSTSVMPEYGETLADFTEDTSASELSLTLDTSYKTLLIFYYISTYDTTYTAEEMLKSIMVNYGNYVGYYPYMMPKGYNELKTGVVAAEEEIEKIELSREQVLERTIQLLDWENANIVNGVITDRNGGIRESSAGKTVIVPINPADTEEIRITIHRELIGERFYVGLSTYENPDFDVAFSDAGEPESGGNEISFPLDPSYRSVCIYFYLSTADTYSMIDLLKSIIVNYGAYERYYPYKTPIGYLASLQNSAYLDEIRVRSTIQIFDWQNARIVNGYISNARNGISQSNYAKCITVPVDGENNDYITLHREMITSRFAVAVSEEEEPDYGEAFISYYEDHEADKITIALASTAKSIAVYYYSANYDEDINHLDILKGLMIEYGQKFSGYEYAYVPYGYDETKERLIPLEENMPKKVAWPQNNGYVDYGTEGQILVTNGDGTTVWSEPFDPSDVAEAVEEYLEEHPEATTTVEDNSLGIVKLTEAARKQTLNNYVTPQMYGAYGDGVHDDTNAIQQAIDDTSVKHIVFPWTATGYKITDTITIDRSGLIIEGSSGAEFNSTSATRIFAAQSMDSMFELTENASFIIMENLLLDCGGDSYYADYGIYSDSIDYVHDNAFRHVNIYHPAVCGIEIKSIYYSMFEYCRCSGGNHADYGYHVAFNGTTGMTSLTFIGCYAFFCNEAAFRIGNLAYSNFISCAADDCKIAYLFESGAAINISGCGCEKCSTPMKITGGTGYTINGLTAQTMNQAADDDAVIYIEDGDNITISGVLIVTENNRTYDVFSENSGTHVIVNDAAIRQNKCSGCYFSFPSFTAIS